MRTVYYPSLGKKKIKTHETLITPSNELHFHESRIPYTSKAQMQSQVLKFLLKENKFNPPGEGHERDFFLSLSPVPTMTFVVGFFFFFLLAVSESNTTFSRTKKSRRRRQWRGTFFWWKCNNSEGVSSGGGLGLGFPIWMLSCFLMGLCLCNRVGVGEHKEGGIHPPPPPSSQVTAHDIPIHWACSCKILILAFKYNPVEWKPLWRRLLILFDNGRGGKNAKSAKMLFVCTHTPAPEHHPLTHTPPRN